MKMKNLRKENHRRADMMERKILLDAITRHASAYRAAFPDTAESDLAMVIAYCEGHSGTRVSVEFNCSESTVYRALARTRDFALYQDTYNRWQPLLDLVWEYEPDFGDCNAQNLLEMLYEKYCDWNDFNDDQTRESIRAVNERLKQLSIPEIDSVMDIVYTVCHNHQRTGFCEGIKIGIRLAKELNI